MSGRFAGHTVVVTGAGAGIGRALAVGFSNDGAQVVCVGRTKLGLQETGGLCARPTFIAVADLGNSAEALAAMADIVDQHGRVDVLINNAGLTGAGAFLDVDFEAWTQAVRVNFEGVAACIHGVLPAMIKAGYGRIVTLTTRMAGNPVPGMSAYGSSKAAVGALTASLAAEVSVRNPDVIINNLIPGPTRTKQNPLGTQDPDDVYPMVRDVVLIPSGGPTGQTFLAGQTYQVFHRD